MKNIVENNKLFAEFLGYSQPHPDYPNTTYWYKKDCQPLTILLFHSDWNWLMRVVEKIENLQDENSCAIYNVQIEQCFVEIIINHTSETIVEVDSNSKIQAVYQACVEFIKWHNKLNKSYEKN